MFKKQTTLMNKLSSAARLFIAGVVVAFFAVTAQATTLADLDHILTQAPDLNAFLANQALIDQYYTASVDYYGGGAEKFPRVSYDAILAQMRVVSAAYPALAQRSWETNLGETFSVKSNAPTYARNLNQTAWDDYLKTLMETLRTQSGDLAKSDWSQALPEVNAGLDRVQALMSQHENEMATPGLSKSDRQVKTAAFFQSLKTNSDLQRISSFLVLKSFESPRGQEILDSGNPDLLLNYFKEIKDQPKILLAAFEGITRPELLGSPLKQKLPDPASLMKDTPIFPQKFIIAADGTQTAVDAGSAGEWVFKPSPRRFHAFFKGMYFGECVGGSSRADFLPSLSPERWATIILKDTQFHFIEKNGKFQGWVQAVPILQGGETYASIDLASHSFRQSIIQKRADGRIISEPMLAGWLSEAMLHKPASWKGFVVSQSNAINNGGALPTVRSMPAYILGEKFSPELKPFAHSDPDTVKILTNIIPRVGYAQNYGGSMIFDAAVPTAKTLTVLKPTDRSLYDIFREAIQNNNKALVEQTLETLHTSAMSDVGNEILTLRGAGVLRMLAEGNYRLPNKKVYWSIDPMDYITTLINAGLTLEEMKQAQLMMAHSVDSTMAFTKALIESKLVTTGSSYVSAIAYEVNVPSEPYKDALATFIKTNVPGLRKKFPDLKIADFVRLELLTKSIEAGIAVVNEAIPAVKTAQDMIDLFSEAYKRGNEKYKIALNTPLLHNVEWFFKNSLTQDQAVAFARLAPETWTIEQGKKFVAALASSNLKDSMLAIGQRIENKSISAQIIRSHAAAAAASASTPEQKRELLKLHNETMPHLNLETGWKEAYFHRVKQAQTSDEMVDELNQFPNATGTYRTAIAEVKAQEVTRFLAMAPTYEQIMKVLRVGILFQDSCIALTKAAAEKSTTIAEFVAPFELHKDSWTTPDYKNKRAKTLQDTQAKLLALPDFTAQLPAVRQLETLVPEAAASLSTAIINKIQAEMATQTSVKALRVLASASIDAYKGSPAQAQLIEAMRAQHARFLSLNPAKDEQEWYNSTFLKFHERVAQVFRRKAVRCELAAIQ